MDRAVRIEHQSDVLGFGGAQNQIQQPLTQLIESRKAAH